MAQTRLRVYWGPESTATAEPNISENEVRIRVGEVLPLLADAMRSERTWLRDFAEDEVTISTDLYEVLLAYQHCRRPSA